jgi:hypothetical protein
MDVERLKELRTRLNSLQFTKDANYYCDLLSLIDAEIARIDSTDSTRAMDEAVRDAIDWQECLKQDAQHKWKREDPEWKAESGAQEQHDAMIAAYDLAIQALRRMQPDNAGLDMDADDYGNGYSRGYADGLQAQMWTEPCAWCEKTLTLFTHSGKYIPENQPPRNYCSACGRKLKGEEK